MVEQKLSQIKALLEGTVSEENQPSELRILCRRLNDLERQAVTGQGEQHLEESLAAEVRHLLGATALYEERSLGFRRPATDLLSVVERVKQAKLVLEQDKVRRRSLQRSDHSNPGAEAGMDGPFWECARRYLDASMRLQRKLNLYSELMDPGFLGIYLDLVMGNLAGSDSRAKTILRTQLAPWEEMAFMKLRQEAKREESSASFSSWCNMGVAATAARRVWAVIQLASGEDEEALIRSIKASSEMAEEMISASRGMVHEKQIMELERSALRLVDMVITQLSEEPEYNISGILEEIGDHQDEDDPLATLTRARASLVELVDEVCGREVNRESQIGPPKVLVPAVDPPSLIQTVLDHGFFRGGVKLRHLIMALALVLAVGLLLGWKLSLQAAMAVDKLDVAELKSVAPLIQSGFMLDSEDGSGEVLVARVSESWVDLTDARQQQLVRDLAHAFRDRGVVEVLVQNSAYQALARMRGKYVDLIP